MKPIIWPITLLVIAFTSCQSESKVDTANPKKSTSEKNLLAHARIDTAKQHVVNNELSLTGKITFNQDKVVKVFPLVSGHLDAVKVELGDYVKAGQVLAVMRSGDLADLEQQAVTARGALSVALKNRQVAEDMTQSGLTSQRELIAAREQLAAAQGEVGRVAERRRIVGGNGSTYVIKAPMSGFVVEKSATQGMELRSDDPENLFTISNLDQVWVLANVYESDVANVKVGYPARITTLSYPDYPYTGRVDKIFNVLDPQSKTLKVRVTLTNADFKLKPEMFANVTLEYAGREQRVAIPATAIVFDKSRNFVVTVTSSNQPVVREVNVFKTVGSTAYLNSGIKPGERVVTQDQLLIYNALAN